MLITHSADAKVRQRGKEKQKKTKTPNRQANLRGQVTDFTIIVPFPFFNPRHVLTNLLTKGQTGPNGKVQRPVLRDGWPSVVLQSGESLLFYLFRYFFNCFIR